MDEWYFAYGSNLCVDQMVRRTGPVRLGNDRPRVVQLPGYRLAFNMQSDGGQVFANIVRPGEGVVGVVYRCSPEALALLDEYESGYERQRVTVVDDRGAELAALTYVAMPGNVVVARTPDAEYLQRVVGGARQHGLPEAYIRSITAEALLRQPL
ncbi:hypothetical protein AYO44_15325 [Planctomycetaceae bacterium SCGC AG-212-F19]|nr:hypothetical protein AYO44_15325 [Planctomycetaceae bacterium SCGC AG-212-F19]